MDAVKYVNAVISTFKEKMQEVGLDKVETEIKKRCRISLHQESMRVGIAEDSEWRTGEGKHS